MNEAIFQPIAKVLVARRPAWTFVIEDNLVRIQTGQFVVKWDIIDEILSKKDFKLDEVIMHQGLGLVITMLYTGGR